MSDKGLIKSTAAKRLADQLFETSVNEVQIPWKADAGGDVDLELPFEINGVILSAAFTLGTPSPTTHTVQLQHSSGIDHLNGLGTGLTADYRDCPLSTDNSMPIPVSGKPRLIVNGSVAGSEGVLWLWLR